MIGLVHDNTELPLIEKAGMTLAPGFKHRLTFTKKKLIHYHHLIQHVQMKFLLL